MDDLAEAARWSRSNAATLKDTHWIGGDPARLEVYGWASWSSQKGIVVLRNPSEHEQAFSLDVATAFELPAHAAQTYSAQSPWARDKKTDALHLSAGKVQRIILSHFKCSRLRRCPPIRLRLFLHKRTVKKHVKSLTAISKITM